MPFGRGRPGSQLTPRRGNAIAFCYRPALYAILPPISRSATARPNEGCRAAQQNGGTMPTIRPKLHHVTMKTSRLDEMIAWYKLLIGAEVNFKNDVAAWMTNDEANHRIAFLAVPGLGDGAEKVRHNGMHHSAFEYDTFDDLMSTFDRLRKAGVEPAFCLDHGLTISLYYTDP